MRGSLAVQWRLLLSQGCGKIGNKRGSKGQPPLCGGLGASPSLFSPAPAGLCWRMKEKVQGSLTQEERAASCKLSIGLPGPYIVVAIPCGRHAWAAHYPRFHLQCHSPAKSAGGKESLTYAPMRELRLGDR